MSDPDFLIEEEEKLILELNWNELYSIESALKNNPIVKNAKLLCIDTSDYESALKKVQELLNHA